MTASARQNPFEFGGELKTSSLIDRKQELDLVIRTTIFDRKLSSAARERISSQR